MNDLSDATGYPLREGNLTKGWTSVTVADVVTAVQPGFASGEHNKDGMGIPHIRPMNISRDGELDLSEIKYVSPDNSLRLSPGDVLFNNTNSPILVGKTTAITSKDDLAFSNHMTRLTPASGVSNRFLARQLHFLWGSGYFRHLCVNHVNQASISRGLLSQVPITLAPAQEQNRIAEKLEELLTDLDAGIAALERARANLKRYRATVLKAAVEGRLTEQWRKEHPDVEPASKLLERILAERRTKWEEAQLAKSAGAGNEPAKGWKEKYREPSIGDYSALPSLPPGWAWTSVDTVGNVLLGRQRAPQYVTGRYSKRYLRVANIKDDRVDFSDLEEMDFDTEHFQKYRLEPGDILVSEGQSPELLGQSAIFPGYDEELCFQKTLHRFRAYPFATTSRFAQIVFRAHVRTGIFRKLGSITTNIAHLTLEKFCAAPFPLAPVEEQGAIMIEVDTRLASINHAERELGKALARASRLRQSILKRAFEGKLVPQDPNDEPASVLLERIREVRAAESAQRVPKRRKSPA